MHLLARIKKLQPFKELNPEGIMKRGESRMKKNFFIFARKRAGGLQAIANISLTTLSLLIGNLFLPLFIIAQPAGAETTLALSQEGYRLKELPRVYLETQNMPPEVILPELCRQELPFVELVTDLEAAQVEVFITALSQEDKVIYALRFQGRKELAGEHEELQTELPVSTALETVRQEILSLLKPGLMRFIGQSAASRRLQVKFREQVKPTAVTDPWNFWVFSLSFSSFFMGEKLYNYRDIDGSFSANRVTPEWKIRLSLSGSWKEDEFQYGNQTIKSSYQGKNFRALVVRSLNDHWSAGAYLSLSSSTYDNIRLSIAPAPAVEYNVFSYSESTRRQLRFLYRLSFAALDYREETIYLKTRENLWRQSLTATLELKRKWGTVSLSLDGSNYFHDFRQNRVALSSEVSLRIFKGLSVSLNGDYSRIHDQLALPRRGASLEEVLLRRRQLQTSYNYYLSVSLNYTFGSIVSNIVNPRFGSGGGTSIYISM